MLRRDRLVNICRRFERVYSFILSVKQSKKSGLLDLEGEHTIHFRNVSNSLSVDNA